MITWMQRHKKWLVITIWISTIAFVGAGFVGWGSYEYGKQGGVVMIWLYFMTLKMYIHYFHWLIV